MDDGFKNLNRALERFREHEASVRHEAVLKIAATKSASSGIGVQLSAQSVIKSIIKIR